ncbi:dehydrogenase B1 [Perilla frutescens var. hirtella]|nr:dehydrogenase B1 [Perilla frutescens var. hirtella]
MTVMLFLFLWFHVLNESLRWGGQSDYVFSALEGDFMKPRIDEEIEDAQRICRTIVDCFERASLLNLSDEKRRKLLHFVVVGGGPTGVEFAAELHDYVNEDLVKLYPKVKEVVKITLLEATNHILNMYPSDADKHMLARQTGLSRNQRKVFDESAENHFNFVDSYTIQQSSNKDQSRTSVSSHFVEVPHINQQNTWDFGLACTLMVLQALGVCDYTIQELVDLCCTISGSKDSCK